LPLALATRRLTDVSVVDEPWNVEAAIDRTTTGDKLKDDELIFDLGMNHSSRL
jgi:hypothetical protein